MRSEPRHQSFAAGTAEAPPAAQAIGIVKRFGSREVLSDVHLTVERGQVHALIGSNGSGKSTLVKILTGYYPRDNGALLIGDATVPQSAGVADSLALGVRVVHQDLGLIDGVSVLENVAAGRGYVTGRFGQIDWRATQRRVEAALDKVGLGLGAYDAVENLPTWQRVTIACARALYDGLDRVRLLVLDEITAALPPGEVRLVLDLIRRLQSLGAGILYVTHRFEEVMEVAGRVSVLRDGKVLLSVPTEEITVRQLIEYVSGDTMPGAARALDGRTFGKPVLEMRGLCTGRLRDIDLTVRAGEVCGVIGRAGCGKSALGRTIIGQERVTAGSIMLDGTPLRARHPRDAIRRGVAYVPQDRLRAGVLPGASIRENFTIVNLAAVSRRGVISADRERAVADDLIGRFGVVPREREELVQNLSGGNQQKIVFGRWALTGNRLFVLDEPTEGVDVAARAGIYQFIRQCADAGAAVLVLSASLEEIVEICDRAVLLTDGAVTDEVADDALSVRHMEHLLMSGAEDIVSPSASVTSTRGWI